MLIFFFFLITCNHPRREKLFRNSRPVTEYLVVMFLMTLFVVFQVKIAQCSPSNFVAAYDVNCHELDNRKHGTLKKTRQVPVEQLDHHCSEIISVHVVC